MFGKNKYSLAAPNHAQIFIFALELIKFSKEYFSRNCSGFEFESNIKNTGLRGFEPRSTGPKPGILSIRRQALISYNEKGFYSLGF